MSVLLGNVTILANGNNGDSNVFRPTGFGFDPGVDDIFLDDGFGGLNSVLDLAANMTYDSLTVNITAAIPEPSSMVLAGIAGSAGAFCFWRRRPRKCGLDRFALRSVSIIHQHHRPKVGGVFVCTQVGDTAFIKM